MSIASLLLGHWFIGVPHTRPTLGQLAVAGGSRNRIAFVMFCFVVWSSIYSSSINWPCRVIIPKYRLKKITHFFSTIHLIKFIYIYIYIYMTIVSVAEFRLEKFFFSFKPPSKPHGPSFHVIMSSMDPLYWLQPGWVQFQLLVSWYIEIPGKLVTTLQQRSPHSTTLIQLKPQRMLVCSYTWKQNNHKR